MSAEQAAERFKQAMLCTILTIALVIIAAAICATRPDSPASQPAGGQGGASIVYLK